MRKCNIRLNTTNHVKHTMDGAFYDPTIVKNEEGKLMPLMHVIFFDKNPYWNKEEAKRLYAALLTFHNYEAIDRAITALSSLKEQYIELEKAQKIVNDAEENVCTLYTKEDV